ncbi:Ig-like domain-containing protein [Paenibacillus chitinolyticus]|uniref:Ig-like domain-containing protein n=1 Tax=Paenibacillus chitinolyticus TaxID=79263 RepID=UPI00366C6579
MKNYNNWMIHTSFEAESTAFDLCEKTKVKINGSSEKIECIINDANEWQTDITIILLIRKGIYDIKTGDIVDCLGSQYIIHYEVEDRDFFWAAKAKRCTGLLNWIDFSGKIHSAAYAFKNDTTSNFGLTEGLMISTGNERRQIIIQLNKDTKQLNKTKRFILDERAWKITSFDRLQNGLIFIVLQEDEISTNDNLDLEIADYHVYIDGLSIRITNENISVQPGSKIKISANVYYKDKPVDKRIIFSSSIETVASINESGILSAHSVGQVIITASLADNPSISTSIDVTIVDIPKLYTIEIESNSTLPHEIKNGQSKTYIAKVYENSSLVLGNLEWQLFSDDQISPTSLGLINSQTNESCIVKNNRSNSGYIQLKVSLVKDASIYRWLRLQMKPLV